MSLFLTVILLAPLLHFAVNAADVAVNISAPAFTISHKRKIIITRLDPIVSPGGISGHMHSVVGGNKFASKYDSATLVSSDCTTANIKTDFSNYWVPTLYFQFKNGSFGIVGGGVSYVDTIYNNIYDQGDTKPGKVFPFPPGMSFLAGNATSHGNASSTSVNKAQSWKCLGGGVISANTPNFPFLAGNKGCTSVVGQIYMPNCWDGVNVVSKNNSHVAYPINNVQTGPCPAGWLRLPSMSYEFGYNTDPNIYNPDTGKFVLSGGDTTGYSYHADFTNGWVQTDLEKLVTDCFGSDKGSGPCASASKMINNSTDTCTYKGEIASEDIGQASLLTRLPGCNPIFGTNDTKASCTNATILIVNKLTGATSTPLPPAVANATSTSSSPASSVSTAPISTSSGSKSSCSKKRRRRSKV